MPEEQMDANTAAESSEAANPEAEKVQTPEEANSSPKQKKEEGTTEQVPFHKHPRWTELVNEKNQLKNQLEELHSQMAGELQKKENPVEKIVQRYVKAGMKEDAARLLAEGQYELGSKAAEEKFAPLERANLETQSTLLFNKFAESHTDYEKIRPQMSEIYNSLPDQDKNWVSSNSQGLQYLYDRAKSKELDVALQESFNKGVQEGYKRKQEKSAVAPSTGASTNMPDGEYSEDRIAKMSVDEYRKHQKNILSSRGMR